LDFFGLAQKQRGELNHGLPSTDEYGWNQWLWGAPAERSGDGAFEDAGHARASAVIQKRCRRCALPPHSKELAAIATPLPNNRPVFIREFRGCHGWAGIYIRETWEIRGSNPFLGSSGTALVNSRFKNFRSRKTTILIAIPYGRRRKFNSRRRGGHKLKPNGKSR
jgi:hypothetical protein